MQRLSMTQTQPALPEADEAGPARTRAGRQPSRPSPPPPRSQQPQPPYRWRWPALFIILLARILDLFDASVISVAGPVMRTDLGGTYAQLQWFGAAYTLAVAVGLITGGRLGDIYGRRRVFVVGVIGFMAGSVACSLAQSSELLISCRAVQGAFAAIMIPQQFGIIKGMFHRDELPKAFGVLGPVIGLATIGAPILGGVLIHADLFGTGWRMIFLINVPIGLLLLAGTLVLVPESRSAWALRPDLVGMVLVTAGALLVVYPLVQGRQAGWPPWTFASLGSAVPVIAVFWWYEVRKQRRDDSPLILPQLFGTRSFAVGLLVGLTFYAALSSFMLIFVLYLQSAAGYTALQAGLALVPWSVGAAVGSTLSGFALAPRFGRRTLHAGLFIMALGVGGLSVALGGRTGLTTGELVSALLVAGFGMGLALAPFLDIVLWGVDQEEVGAASGILNANHQLGSTVGIAVLGTVFFALVGGQAGDRHSWTVAFDRVLWIEAALLLSSFLLAFLLPMRRPSTAG
jgi:EmrB/QacA subfamily drug resistance transporter